MDEAKLKLKIVELKRNWAELKPGGKFALKTLRTVEFTEAQWRTLARYTLDPKDPEALRAMPIKLVEFTAAAREIAIRFAEQQDGVVKKILGRRDVSLPKEFRELAEDLDKDLHTIAHVLFSDPRGRSTKTEIEAGIYKEGRSGGKLHTDESDESFSIITGRINLDCQYLNREIAANRREEVVDLTTDQVRDQGLLESADKDGIYLMTVDEYARRLKADYPEGLSDQKAPYDKDSVGTLHGSCVVPIPTPALFARLFCYSVP